LRTPLEEQANRIAEQVTLIEKMRAEMTVLLARLSSNSGPRQSHPRARYRKPPARQSWLVKEYGNYVTARDDTDRMTTAVLEKTVADTAQTISQAYRFELDPTREQISALNSHIGGARACYNQLLGLVKENWDENRVKKGAGAEVAREDYLGTYHLDLQKLWYLCRYLHKYHSLERREPDYVK
jgi:uncharacterized coiled-coil protein SlyX